MRLFMLRSRSRLVVRIGGLYRGGVRLRVRADIAGLTESEKKHVLATVREILLARAGELTSETPSIVETRGQLSFQLVDDAGVASIRNYTARGEQVIDAAGNAVDPAPRRCSNSRYWKEGRSGPPWLRTIPSRGNRL
jgi:hypothetical protein